MQQVTTFIPRAREARTPHLVLDLDRIRANVDRLRSAFARLSPTLYYAVKANPDPRVLATVRDLGCGFDVASINEVRQLQTLGVPGARMTFSATVKVPDHVEEAHARGVDCFAMDSPGEVEKLARLAPGSRAMVRIEAPHEGSRWPLDGKFGVPEDQAVDLLELARRLGLVPFGVTFHVGSQCLRPANWVEAIERCGRVWRGGRARGMELRLVNLGGGLPSRYTEDVPDVGEIGGVAGDAALSTFGPDVAYAFEPGRSLVADAGTLVTRVIGKATRHGKRWVFVDLSIYAGLLEVIGGWSYPIRTPKDHLPTGPAILAGPSCDSTDVLARDIALPDLEVGDPMRILAAGAYTTSYRNYNGFAYPDVLPLSRSAPGDDPGAGFGGGRDGHAEVVAAPATPGAALASGRIG